MADVTKATRPARQAAGRGRQAADQAVGKGRQAAEEGPQKMLPDGLTSELGSALQNVAMALAERALSSVTGKVEGVTGRLTDFAQGDGGGGGLLGAITGSDKSPGSVIAGAATGAFKGAVGSLFKGKGKGKGSKKLKLTNIIETIDVGAPRRVVYNQWTQFQEFPSFMKKVEKVNQESDEKLAWKAQIFLSHREWKSTIREQVPDERIIWRSEGAKGYVDGAVTFHELTPDLTRVVVVLEYHPQGLFERTGNLWRAQGRRARLELKHFRRHVMTNVLLHPEEMEEGGWRGEIHDGEVVKDHETAVNEEREREEGEEEEPTDELEEGEEEEEEEEPEEEEEEPEEGERAEADEEEEEEEEPEEEEEEEEEPAETAEAEEEEPEEEEPPRRARAAPAARGRSRGQGAERPVRRRRTGAEEEAPARRKAGSRGK